LLIIAAKKGRSLSDQPLKRRGDVMKKGRNTAEVLDSACELDDIELLDDECQERRLVLKAAPPSRRTQLMAHGVKEIRCSCCNLIRPLAGAEESEEGWICEDCASEMMERPKYGGQKGR
jgi:LSD1 subclass zinc finger protein